MREHVISKAHKPVTSQAELLGAALRYCAVADWFEAHPSPWSKTMSLDQAMGVFNRVETELRQLGTQAMRQRGRRDLALRSVGIASDTEEATV